MHPIVIIASDKDPAIGAAVDGLQAAGFEVRVLNTATAKLVDFLGALAGEEDEEDTEKKPDAPEDDKEDTEPKVEKPPKDAPDDDEELSDENDPLDPKKMEALIAGEPVLVEIVDGAQITLHPNKIVAGARTSYSLNEAQFAFWPSAVSNEPITGGVDLSLNDQNLGHLTVIFSEEAMNPPVLKIGREWLKTIIQRKNLC